MKKLIGKIITRSADSQDGFTLIEILMAVLIIVILAVVGITQFQNFSADAKNAATKSNLAILRNAIAAMNALERVRCAKTNVLFPDINTLQSNDISGCGCTAALCTAGAAPVLAAACNPTTLIDPNTNAAFGACGAGGAPAAFLTLIPLIDRPFVQNTIPNNPWTAGNTVQPANRIQRDNSPAAGAISCGNAPNDTSGAGHIAGICNTGANATPFLVVGGTAFSADATPPVASGWCYCEETGQIWANTGNNDGVVSAAGAVDGLGTESQF